MKKLVLKLEVQDVRDKRRAMRAVCAFSGINEITVDAKAKKLTLIGTVDPVTIVITLRKKNWSTNIISVGPAKEPEPEPEKKEVGAKEESKKDEPNKEKEKKSEPEFVVGSAMPFRQYYPPINAYYYNYANHRMEENYPNGCIIC